MVSVSDALQRGSGVTRKKILDSAERLFAETGYWGTSVREIVAEAGVKLGLISHYFGNKDELFRQVLLRRADAHAASLGQELDRVLSMETPPSLEDLIRAYIGPQILLAASGDEGWRNYTHLVGRVMTGRQYHDFVQPLTDAYDPVVKRFLQSFQSAFTVYDKRRLYLGFYFLQSSFFHIILESGLLERHSGDTLRSGDLEMILDEMVPFFGAAFRARIGTPG